MKKKLSILEQRQLKIARDTLHMPNAMVGVMGGMTKAKAQEIILHLELTALTDLYDVISQADGNFRITVEVGNSSDGEEVYEESCDAQIAQIRAVLPKGWTARWAGAGNTDGDGICTEDIYIEVDD